MTEKIKRVSWEDLESLNKILIKKLEKEKFDYLLCIGSGGLILGKLISDSKGIPLAAIIAESYEKGEQKKKEVQISNIASVNPLYGRILVVDDLADSGDTLQKVLDHLKKLKMITELKIAVTFTKPWSKVKPHFFAEETDAWIIFPYEKTEFVGS